VDLAILHGVVGCSCMHARGRGGKNQQREQKRRLLFQGGRQSGREADKTYFLELVHYDECVYVSVVGEEMVKKRKLISPPPSSTFFILMTGLGSQIQMLTGTNEHASYSVTFLAS
jgi:hypothetical protein